MSQCIYERYQRKIRRLQKKPGNNGSQRKRRKMNWLKWRSKNRGEKSSNFMYKSKIYIIQTNIIEKIKELRKGPPLKADKENRWYTDKDGKS